MGRRFKRISLCSGCHPRILESYHSNNTDMFIYSYQMSLEKNSKKFKKIQKNSKN